MAQWITINGEQLFPETVKEALEALEPVAEALEEGLTTASEGLEVLEDLVSILGGVVSGGSAAFIALVEALLEDLAQTQVSTLYIAPVFSRYDEPGGLRSYGRAFKAAISDTSDFERPTFDENDISGGVFIQVNAPSFAEAGDIAELLKSVFGDRWQSVIDLARALPGANVPAIYPDVTGTITSIPEGKSAFLSFSDSLQISPNGIDLKTGTRCRMITGRNAGFDNIIGSFETETGTYNVKNSWRFKNEVGDTYVISGFKPSRPPDWETVRLVDVIPPLSGALRVLSNAAVGARATAGFATAFSKLVLAIQQKIALLQQTLIQVQEIIDAILALGSIANINVLPVSFAQGGNGRFVQEFENSTNKPPVDDDNVSLGLVIYGGAGATAVFKALFAWAEWEDADSLEDVIP